VSVRGPEGASVVALAVEADGFPSIGVLHTSGRPAVNLVADASQRGGATLAVGDARGEQQCVLTLAGDGEGHLTFNDTPN
jgi:hypothetical protein